MRDHHATMKTKTLLFIVAALFPPYFAGQQSPLPQPSQTSTQPPPCVAIPASPKPQKPFPFHLPPKIQQQIDKERAKIANKTGVTIPQVTPEDLAKHPQPVRPCVPVPAPTPAPPVIPIPATTPSPNQQPTPPKYPPGQDQLTPCELLAWQGKPCPLLEKVN